MSALYIAEPVSRTDRSVVKVSVIMLTYNRPQYIGRAIESVRSQDLQEWELIVVHDGPNRVIADIMREYEQVDPRIRYFHRLRGGNIANATNYGLARAGGEYIAILDDDDYWASPGKLTKQIEFLDANPDYSACGGGMIVLDETGTEKLRYFKQQNDADLKRWALLANPIAHSTAMFRRSLLVELGGYDESLSGFQDWDVFLKLGQCGKLYNFQDEFTCYTIWGGGGSFAQSRNNTRSALRIVKRHGSAYRSFPLALSVAGLHYIYARLPRAVRERSFSWLSRAKKAIFSGRARQAAPRKSGVSVSGLIARYILKPIFSLLD